MKRWAPICFILFFNFTLKNKAQNIYTIAGTGNPSYGGDGGLAINSTLQGVTGIALDKIGNIFICDNINHRIRKIDVNGIITTIAGGGTSYSDSIVGTSAIVTMPWGICTDDAGNVYFTEGHYNQVKKINSSGMITTVAGAMSTGGFAGDGGLATQALFKNICNVVVDKKGNILISDAGNNRIRKVNTAGIISTIAGSPSGSFGDGIPASNAILLWPGGIAVDKIGNIFIGELNGYLVRKVDTLGIITTIAGNGTQGYTGDGGIATNASLGLIQGICCDTSGNVFIADKSYSNVRKIDKQGIITTVAGTTYGYSGDGGPATLAQVNPWDAELDSIGNMYIADGTNNVVRKICANSCVAGLSEINNHKTIVLHPNPVTTILQITDNENIFDNSVYEISNYLGQIVVSHAFENTIDVSKLPTGIYTLKILTMNKQRYFSKFIKE